MTLTKNFRAALASASTQDLRDGLRFWSDPALHNALPMRKAYTDALDARLQADLARVAA